MADDGREMHEATLTRWMEAYEKDVLRMCCMLLKDINLAEDAAQETFLKAYQGMEKFRGDCSEKTWIMRIAVNTCKDVRRSVWFRRVDGQTALERLPEPSAPPSQEHADLVQDVLNLPFRERQAILLHYYQGMTVAQTAQALGISGAAVVKRLKHARSRLRQTLEEDEDNV